MITSSHLRVMRVVHCYLVMMRQGDLFLLHPLYCSLNSNLFIVHKNKNKYEKKKELKQRIKVKEFILESE